MHDPEPWTDATWTALERNLGLVGLIVCTSLIAYHLRTMNTIQIDILLVGLAAALLAIATRVSPPRHLAPRLLAVGALAVAGFLTAEAASRAHALGAIALTYEDLTRISAALFLVAVGLLVLTPDLRR